MALWCGVVGWLLVEAEGEWMGGGERVIVEKVTGWDVRGRRKGAGEKREERGVLG